MKTLNWLNKTWLMSILFIFTGIFGGSFAQDGTSVSLPSDHGRWIGTLEGSEVDSRGSGLVYEFVFNADGTVAVEKSMTVRKLEQSFNWTYEGKNIALTGDSGGPISELAGATLNFITEKNFEIKTQGGTDVEIRKSKPWLSWLHLLFFFVLLMAGNELSRYSKVASYVLYFIIPIVFIPLWLNAPFDGWFRWIKLYSAVAGSVIFTIFRFHGVDKNKWWKFAVMAILAINIAEAVMQDWSQPDLANKLNAFAGVLNIVTISRWMTIKRDESKPHDMLWPGMTTFWILAYDLWNFVFSYLNFPNTVAISFVVLLAPTIAAMFIKKGTWLQARAFTLAIYFIYLFTFKGWADNNLDVSLTVVLPRSEGLAMGLAIASLVVNVIYFALHYYWRATGKAPKNLEVGQSESVI
jgi:hypothetical protein